MATAQQLRSQFLSPTSSAPRIGVSSPSALGISTPAPIAKPKTPITDSLRSTFISLIPTVKKPIVVTPMSTPLFQKPATPIADSLRTKFPIRTPVDSPFVKNLKQATTSVVNSGLSAADHFIGNEVDTVKDFATGKFKVAPQDVVSGLKDTGVGTLRAGGYLAQGFNEGVFRIGTSIAKVALPGYKTSPNSLVKSITGKDSVESYQSIFAGADKWAKEKGATPGGAQTFAGFAVLGTMFMDEPGVGGAAKAPIRLSKIAIDQLASETSDDAIKTILKGYSPDLSDKALDFVTPVFRNAKTPEEVESAVKLINASAKTAAAKAEKASVIENNKAATRTELPDSDIHESLRPLAEEARKYKTADEFLASSEPVYRGVSDKEKTFVPSTKGAHTEEGWFSVTPEKKTAKAYGDNVLEGRLVSSAKVKALPDYADIRTNGSEIKQAQEEGFDAVKFKNRDDEIETVVFKPEVVKTKQELTDLHAQATKAPEEDIHYESTDEPVFSNERPNQSPPVDTNLTKSIGAAKDPYEILNIIKNKYPNLPDKVVDRFVQRFVRTKRLANVENLLHAADNLDKRFKDSDIKVGEKVSAEKAVPEKLPKSSKEVLDKTANPTVRKIMRHDQKENMIRALKQKFEDPMKAVAAQHEYDRIWDDLNQGVVDEFENLSLQKSFLEDAVSADSDGIAAVYKKLFTGVNKKNVTGDSIMELQEIMNRAQQKKKAISNYRRTGSSGDKRYPGNPGKLTKTEEYASELDVYLRDADIEGGDFSIAQDRIERHAELLAQVREITERIKELKPRVREARILQEGLDNIAVVPRKEVEVIDRLITPANIRDVFSDISGFAGQARDLYRNFEKFFGTLYPQIKKAILDPFDEAKGARVDEVNNLAKDLKEGVTERFGFKKGSKESAAIQRYGDPDLPAGEKMSLEDLVKEFGKEKADNIVAADKWFRETYDRLVDELNAVRKKIYPNTPSKLIYKRSNYYRHFQEMNETFGDALREFFETPSGISPGLVGQSEFTKAKTRFLPFAEERTGQVTNLDAIGGFVNYIELFSYAKHIDPQISKFHYLERKLKEVAPTAGTQERLPDGTLFKQKGAENILNFLHNFARDLTGNTNPMDRWVQSWIPGGRRTIRAARFINNRMKANSVGANLGSALAQVANVPAGVADTKQYAAKGLQRTLAGILMPNEPMEKSIFLKERYQKSVGEDFPFQFSDKPLLATGEQLRKRTAWIMQKADEVGTKFIWNSEYEKGLSLERKGTIDNPIKYADAQTRKIVAGRGVGEVPLGQKALATQFIAPFTLEVGNAWWIMKDWVSKKDFTALATFFVANYVLNEIAENTRGSRITFDPINATIQGGMALSDEFKEGNYGRGLVKLLGREAGEILSNIPFGQQVAAVAPDSTVQGATQFLTGAPMDKKEIFGDSVAGRFGTPLIISGLEDAVYRLLPPVGGVQLKKTIQGIQALIKGSAEDSKGSPTFDVKPTPDNVAKALAFGAGATSEARKYYDERSDLFSRLDRQDSERFVALANAEKDWADIKALKKSGKKEEAIAKLKDIAIKDPAAAKKIASVAKSEVQGLNGNERIVKMLGIENGERAKYIADQLRNKKGEGRKAYLANLAQKGLVKGPVLKQVLLLLKQN